MADAAVQDGLDPGTAMPRVQPQPGQAGSEPVQMCVQPVEAPAPDVNDVVCAVRSSYTEIQDRDLRILDCAVPAVDPGGPGRPPRPSFGARVRWRHLHPPRLISRCRPARA